MMKVLFIYPEYPKSFWTFELSLKIIKRKAAYPPLGLLTVAALLPDEWKKRLVDTNVHPLYDEDIMWADIVMISAVRIQKQSTRILVQRLKQAGKKIIAGGPLFSYYYKDYPEIDHFVFGEFELSAHQFTWDVENKSLKKYYKSEERPDLSHTPVPAWHLINVYDYATMSVQFSRGCPFDCDFCDIILLYGRKPRIKNPEQFIGELTQLYRIGWRGSVFIVDDNFFCNRKKTKLLLESMVRWQKEHDYPFYFVTQATVDIADDEECLSLMHKAFFNFVFIGFETTNPDSLEECSKYHNTPENYKNIVKTIHRYGIQVVGGFIIGFDNDRKDVFQNQIDIIQNAGITQAMISMLNAVPNTRLWNRLKKEGRLREDPTGENTDGTINFLPRMDVVVLKQGYCHIMKTIYKPVNFYKRMNDFLKIVKPHEQIAASFDVLSALLRTLWYVGIVSPGRMYFWKLVIKTIFIKARALPDILHMTVAGEHFRIFTKKAIAKINTKGN